MYSRKIYLLSERTFSLKFFKLINSNFEQPENIECIDLTLEVSKLDKFKEDNWEQSVNIVYIYVTLEVLKWDKLNEDNW